MLFSSKGYCETSDNRKTPQHPANNIHLSAKTTGTFSLHCYSPLSPLKLLLGPAAGHQVPAADASKDSVWGGGEVRSLAADLRGYIRTHVQRTHRGYSTGSNVDLMWLSSGRSSGTVAWLEEESTPRTTSPRSWVSYANLNAKEPNVQPNPKARGWECPPLSWWQPLPRLAPPVTLSWSSSAPLRRCLD